jgi:hypothetical protein
MSESSFPWQPNDKTDHDMIACLNFGGEMHLYASGFQDGAEALYKALQEQRHGQDLLVYPFVYCLRHAIELSLKQVIRSGRRLLDEEPDFPDGHDLWKLWTTCRPILKQIWPEEGNESAYFIVEGAIRSLRQIDPAGEGFRYPVGTSGKGRQRTLAEDLRHLDLDQMYEEFKVALDLLIGADAGIDVFMDNKADMEADYRELQREMRAEAEAEMRSYNSGDAW